MRVRKGQQLPGLMIQISFVVATFLSACQAGVDTVLPPTSRVNPDGGSQESQPERMDPSPVPPISTQPLDEVIQKAGPGEVVYTHISSPENGKIAVRVDVPERPRYGERAPIVVVASWWFVEK
jgi:hypothetical protein